MVRAGIALAVCLPLFAAPPRGRRSLLRVPVWTDTRESAQTPPPPLGAKNFSVKVDGEPAPVLAARGPEDDLMVLLVFDVTEDMAQMDIAREALISALGNLPATSHVGLLRAQDGLRVVLDPTTDRAAVAGAIRALPVSGKAGLLDTVETASRIADAILSKSAVRVAILYISDSDIKNYREDFTNPVINSSDQHDMSRRFPEGLVREKVSKLAAKLAGFEAPLFIVHLDYRNDRLNEAYQAGILQLAATTGGAASFCRSLGEIPDAIAGAFSTIASHYSLVLRLPERPPKMIQVQMENNAGRALTYRNRFVLQEK